MTTPRDLLAEALFHSDVVEDWVPDAEDAADDILAASPRLAAALELGLAWEAAEKAAGELWAVSVAMPGGAGVGSGYPGRYEAVAIADRRDLVIKRGPTPARALQALASRLQEQSNDR